MEIQDQFRAAVRIMKSLPKDGPFQPSKDMNLRLRSYYMQSQFGPCDQSPPKFWEWNKKLEYNAWKSLGDMPRLEAMKRYTEELKMIIETMSFNSDVAGFLRTCGPFYEFVDDEGSQDDDACIQDKEMSQCDSSCKDDEDDHVESLSLESGFYFENWNGDYESESTSNCSESSDEEFVDSLDYPDFPCSQVSILSPNSAEPRTIQSNTNEDDLKTWLPTSEVDSMSLDVQSEKAEVLQKLSDDIKFFSERLIQMDKKLDDVIQALDDIRKKNNGEEWQIGLKHRPIYYFFILSWPMLIPLVISMTKRFH